MNDRLRVSQIRAVPEKGNLEANYRALRAILSDLKRHHPDVVVTPECFLDGYVVTESWVDGENLREYAIALDESPYVRGVADWARANAAWVILGCSRLAPEGTYNSAIVLNREGQRVGIYDKTHCQTHDKKSVPGQALPVFDSNFGPFGVMICADRRWPETVRSLALQGARIIFNPTYGMHGARNRWMMQTRSYESEVFIAFTHPRQSLITDPTGEILCDETGRDARFAVTPVDLSRVDAVRSGPSAHLRDRRPDLYVR
jgi:predicted amidohydrolase